MTSTFAPDPTGVLALAELQWREQQLYPESSRSDQGPGSSSPKRGSFTEEVAGRALRFSQSCPRPASGLLRISLATGEASCALTVPRLGRPSQSDAPTHSLNALRNYSSISRIGCGALPFSELGLLRNSLVSFLSYIYRLSKVSISPPGSFPLRLYVPASAQQHAPIQRCTSSSPHLASMPAEH
ncbi:hypothetical protein O181_026761 [Austropuccinia psidii MF-1]|uniref:Uncharacterized protein n=1 Tax=Austropuccinia psidii MF-1 TaxID=1389203 RepID=A0A9Q3H0T4_9BASI|nr:hypothetical protein [Austropuccinia psidii MF-1]